jgi:hypothetical protein
VDKPKQVSQAVGLLVGSTVVGTGTTAIVGFSPNALTAGLPFAIGILVLTLAILLFLIAKISAGRNWARITFTVLFVLGLPTCAALVLTDKFFQNPISGGVVLLQTIVQGWALVLLFTKPGSDWFKKHRLDASSLSS